MNWIQVQGFYLFGFFYDDDDDDVDDDLLSFHALNQIIYELNIFLLY